MARSPRGKEARNPDTAIRTGTLTVLIYAGKENLLVSKRGINKIL